jgi:hypothetical protein
MQKHANLIWFVCSLILLVVSGLCVHNANVAYQQLQDNSHSHFLVLNAFRAIFFEYALTLLLGSLLALAGFIMAVISGIALFWKRNAN